MASRRNDDERRQWIDNDESLYNWQRGSGMNMRRFIREHRQEIDRYIDAALDRPPG